jgi:hypothetical protein
MAESIPALIKLAGLADKLVKVVTKIRSTLDERKVRKDLEESIRDAQRAFYACVPRRRAIHPDILLRGGDIYALVLDWTHQARKLVLTT